MSSYNKVVLMGNLTRDIELRHTQSGSAVGNFGIALNHTYKSASGERKEEVVFVECDVWGKTAEVMTQHLGKGRAVLVDGRLRLDQWQAKDGIKQSKLKVVVERFEFVGSKPDGEPRVEVQPSGLAVASSQPDTYGPLDDESIPF